MDKIVIVGFSGAGKTSIGRRLAKRLNWNFVDTDSFFEEKYHISIEDFFRKYGEEAFRLCEKEVLSQVLAQNCCVISTGGGLPCFHGNMATINENAYTIYLKLAPASLVDRIVHSHKVRPLVSHYPPDEMLQYISQLLLSREIFYNQANLVVKGENLSVTWLYDTIKNTFK